MPSCKEVATAVSSGEIENAGFFRRLAIRFHLWICQPCRTYIRQMEQIGNAARRALGHVGAGDESLSSFEERVIERCGEAAVGEKSDTSGS